MAQMRICFIGDSFVSGAYDEDCIGWVGRIAAAARKRGHDLSPYNLGIRGETSVQIGRRWRAEAEPRQSPQQEGRLVFEFGKASTSLLQRRLRIGYGRAAHLIDMMYNDGLVGPADGSKPRFS